MSPTSVYCERCKAWHDRADGLPMCPLDDDRVVPVPVPALVALVEALVAEREFVVDVRGIDGEDRERGWAEVRALVVALGAVGPELVEELVP